MKVMKLIIAGSRTIELEPQFLFSILDRLTNTSPFFDNFDDLEVVSGGAGGMDRSGEKFVEWYVGTQAYMSLKKFPADWNTHGKAAGPIRNRQMAEYADALVLIWDGESKGSANMKMEMLSLNKPVFEIIMRSHNETK